MRKERSLAASKEVTSATTHLAGICDEGESSNNGAEMKTHAHQQKGMGAVRLIHFDTSDVNRSFTAHDASDSTRSYSSKPAWAIPICNLKYTKQSCVGTSVFGSVYKGFWLDTPVVVKFMGYEADDDPNDESKLKLFRHELRVWFPLKHPHAINLFGACDVGKRFFVCEYAANGTLCEHIHKLPSENEKWTRLYEVSLGL
jgi:serine/threonine protein kinase